MERGYGSAWKINKLRPLHSEVIVRDMEFSERKLASGIVLLDDNKKSEGIRPRWAEIYAVGPKQTQYKVGQWILVAHGRWTRGALVEIDGAEMTIRRVDLNEILLVSDEKPTDESLGLSGATQKEM